MYITDYFADLLAGNIFGSKTDPGIPETYYIGLSLTSPTASGSGYSEPDSSAGYARVQITGLGEPANGVVTSTSQHEFNESTDAWGTIPYWLIFDSAADGNLLMYGSFDEEKVVGANSSVLFSGGAISFSVFGLS